MAVVLFALAAACCIYGATVMLVGSGTWFFAVWYVLGALLALAGWAVHAGWWSALPLMGRRIASIVACVALAGFAVTAAFITSNFNSEGEDDLDYLVVLGAQVRDDGPSVVLRNRLDAACDYLKANERTRCIVSGGQGANEPTTEAHAMAEYLRLQGIDSNRIIEEGASLNTVQNIRNSMAFIGPDSTVGIVTNNFHLFRALGIARKQGLENVCGIASPSSPWFLPNNVLRESMGVAKDTLQGNM